MKPLELVHLDISEKVEPAMSGSAMIIAFLDDFTAKSDVMQSKRRVSYLVG